MCKKSFVLISIVLVLGLTAGISNAAQIPIPSGFPNASNTGIAGAGVSMGDLTSSGSMVVTTDGAVIELMNISGGIRISASNVTVRKCYITGGLYGVNCTDGYPGALIEDCTITNGGERKGICGNNMTVRRCDISDYQDGIFHHGNVVLEDNYIHDLYNFAGAHVDGIQCSGSASNITVRHNTIQGQYQNQTSAIIYQTNWGILDNVLIENNFLSGGTYTIYLRERNDNGPPTNVTLKDNVWEKDSYAFGHISYDGSHTFICNTFHTGEPIPQNPPCGAGNIAPVANAGPDQQVTDDDNNGSEDVTLDGSNSYDPDGSIVSYVWKEGGNQIATGVDPNVSLDIGQHTIALTVTDNNSATDDDTVIITVNSAGAPLPGQASNPSPANGASGVSTTADLSWTAGSDATSHDVYFGTDSTPDSTEFKDNQTGITYDPATLDANTTYYWRIDEKNATGTTTGIVWHFNTNIGGGNTFYVDPASGSMSNDGSSGSPWSTLQAVFENNKIETKDKNGNVKNSGAPVKAGDTILLRSGYHGDIVQTGYFNDQVITVAAQTGHTPGLRRLQLSGAKNWLFKGLSISTELSPSFAGNLTLVNIASNSTDGYSSYVTIEDCLIYSAASISGWTAADWNAKNSNGMSFDVGGSHMTARNNIIKNTDFAIHAQCEHALITGNEIVNFAGDGIRATYHNQTIEYNLIKNCFAVDGNHDDLIQVYLANQGAGLVENMTIRGNVLINNEDPAQPLAGTCQGIGIFDGPYHNFLIENNLVLADHYHGISLYNADNCKIINNTVVNPKWLAGTSSVKSWIMINKAKDSLGGANSTNCTIRNNLATDYQTAGNTNLTMDHNGTITASNYNDYFVDALNFDFYLTPDSPAIDAGIGTGAPTVDIDGYPRPSGDGWDLGCYEYTVAGNIAPVADAGVDQQVTDTDDNGTEVVTLDGSGSYDIDGSIVSYIWKEDSNQIATSVDPNVTLAVGQHTIVLVVTDNNDANDSDTVIINVSAAADSTAPNPDPMTWVTEPYATGSSSISMTATTATDVSGVEYYFDCTTTGGHDSGWQDSAAYEDAGLDADTTYSYQVKARDKSSNWNETGWSTTKSATTDAAAEPNDITGDTADRCVEEDGYLRNAAYTYARVGGGSSDGDDWCCVYVFQLPTLGQGQTITQANLKFYYEGTSYYTPAGNVDIHGIDYRSSSSVQSGDFYQGSFTGDESSTGIQDDIVTPSTSTGTVNTSSSGDTALKNYLNAQYIAGAEGGDYVFLRVNSDTDETNNPMRYYTFSSANHGTAGQRPVLTVTIESSGDTTPPNPDPMTWATEPYATGTTSISMTATTATDPCGVEYYFECTGGGGHDSGWQDGTTYEDNGLSPSTQYSYKAKARDKSSNQNQTGYSTVKSATTLTPDTTPPSPNPMTWASEPNATSASAITMTATTATDASGVEYYFDCVAGGGHDSGWQDSTTYTDTGLAELTQYSYQVKARDKSASQNETGWSVTKSVTTQDGTAPAPDPMTWAAEPYATGTDSIAMTATTASDASGVEYYFDCTTAGGHDSGWQDSITYEDTGLDPNTTYSYRVKARDKSSNQNETAYSAAEEATTDVPADTLAPAPDPMTWAVEPYTVSASSISMTAATATDENGVEYYFECTAGGGHDSGWQDSTTYQDTGLNASTWYSYRVKARDKSSNQNQTAYSAVKSAKTNDLIAGPIPTGWWKLDETSGTTAADSSGYAYDGTVSGATWDSNGHNAGALYFDGTTTNRCEVPGSGLSASAGTVCLWGKLSASQSGTRYFFGHTSNPLSWVNRIQLYMDDGNTQLDLGLGDTHNRATNIMTLSTGTWYHIALTWDGANYAIYVDGNQKASGTYTGLSSLGSFADIGNNGGRNETAAEGFAGLIDDVHIYDDALDADEVNDVYQGTVTEATNPGPANGSNDVSVSTVLTWTPGAYAASHDVYLGTDYNSVADANHSSSEYKGNFDTNSYDPNGLTYDTTYYWAVDEVNGTNVWYSEIWSFTTQAGPADTTAPSPDPMTWTTEPFATGPWSISMTATTATDESGAEYYFDCTTTGGHDSGWQDSSTYEDTGLDPNTEYSYRVKARDKSDNQNETEYSTTKSAVTEVAPVAPAGWWKLDETEGNTAADSSGNDYDGTVTGATWTTSGHIDGALNFDGNSINRLEIPGSPLSASAGTVSLWAMLPATQSGTRYFFGHTSSSTGWADRIQLYMDNDDMQLDLGLGDSHSVDLNIMTFSTATWYHIALTWNGSNYVVYVDGQQKSSGTYSGLSTIGSLADIGNNGGRGSTPDEGFSGRLDDVRIYDKALTAAEVNDICEGVVTEATNPSPADEADNVSASTTLSWTSGVYAASHDVYLGTDYNSIADANYQSPEYQGNFDTNSYDPNGLSYSTTYYWAVDEVNGTSSLWLGDIWSFTTEAAADTTAPSPDPMTWASEPNATGTTSISMTAATATDVSGVEYYFDCTTSGGHDSGWQDSITYTDTALSPSTQYSYQVKARDKSSNQNETAYSTIKSATTDASAEPNDIDGDTSDRCVEEDGYLRNVADTYGRVGAGSADGDDWCCVYVFQLPTLGQGQTITEANLKFYYEGTSHYTPAGNVDIHGIDYRSSSSVQSGDFYQGSFTGDPNSTGIQDDTVIPSTSTGTINTSSSGDTALKNYLNAQYTASAEGGDYVFLRLNSDTNETNSPQRYYTFSSANHGTSSRRPVLTVTIE